MKTKIEFRFEYFGKQWTWTKVLHHLSEETLEKAIENYLSIKEILFGFITKENVTWKKMK